LTYFPRSGENNFGKESIKHILEVTFLTPCTGNEFGISILYPKTKTVSAIFQAFLVYGKPSDEECCLKDEHGYDSDGCVNAEGLESWHDLKIIPISDPLAILP
jgi:hypothetical protein